jgi:hypothetical protein
MAGANVQGAGGAQSARAAAAGAYADTLRSSAQGVLGSTTTAGKQLLGA